MAIERINSMADGKTRIHSNSNSGGFCVTNDEGHEENCEPQPQHRTLCSSSYTVSQLSKIKPTSFVKSCFRAYGIDASEMDAESKQMFFLQVTDERISAYDVDIIEAVRKEDVSYLRFVIKSGRSLLGCNPFGESIIHLACRRGSSELVRFLVDEGGASLRVSDDFGRTPLHDACWKKEPEFELIDFILDSQPELLLIADKRGHLPIDYARTHHWGLWIQFLEVRMKKEIRNRLSSFK